MRRQRRKVSACGAERARTTGRTASVLVIDTVSHISMLAVMATSAGHPGRVNEDFVGAVPGAVVLLDGAGIPGAESLCRHGVAWYTHRLGATLLGRLSRGGAQSLVSVLADAIDQLAGEHRSTCDLADPSSPQSTVALLRVDSERADYLMLADSHLLLGRTTGEGPKVVTDVREVAVRRECTARLEGLEAGSRDHEVALDACKQEFRSRRNQPGGYWIAKDDPQAAGEAVTGAVPLAGLTDVALLSNGVTRLVDPYGLATWSTLPDRCRTDGPGAVLEELRRHEAHISEPSDDATVAYSTLRQVPTPV